MSNGILNFRKPKKLDYIIVFLYLIISLFIIYKYILDNESLVSQDFRIVFFYGLFTQMIIYQILYPTIRNLTMYIFWIIVGVGHLILYYYLKQINLSSTDLFNINILRNSIILIVVLQIFRIISLEETGQEFLAPIKLLKEDLYGERNRNSLDMLFFFVYYGLLIGLLLI